MIAGFDTNTDSITKENISRTIAANENSNEIDNRTMSYKEKLLEKQKNYYDRVNKTEHTPNKYSTKTSHKSSRKTKEISLPKEVVTSKRAPRNPSSDYGFLGKPEEKRKKSNISGQVHNEGRKVKSGSYVEIRITEDLVLENIVIPRNTVITAIASFGNQRVNLTINNILYNNERYPVKLEAYGLDGYKGLYDEDIIDKELAESAMNEAIEDGESSVKLPLVGNISLKILKRKLKEQHTILRNEHFKLEFEN